MKKVLFTLATIAVLTSVQSCKKTYTCCYAGNCGVARIESGETYQAFQNRVKAFERMGYTCN